MRRHTSELFIVFLFTSGVVIAQPASSPVAEKPKAAAPTVVQPAAPAAPPAARKSEAAPGASTKEPPTSAPTIPSAGSGGPASAPTAPAAPGGSGLTDVPLGATPSRPGAPAPLPPPVAAVSDSESTASLLSRADELIAQKKYKEAQGLLGAVLNRDAANIDANVLLARIAERMSDYSAARDYYKAIVQIDPSNFEANLGMGRNYLNGRYWRQAPYFLERAVNTAPSDRQAEVYTLLATAYKGGGQMDKALVAAAKAVQIDGTYFEGIAAYVALLAESRKYQSAVDQVRALVQLAENNRAKFPGEVEQLRLLHGSYDSAIKVLSDWHNDLYEHDARGRPTDRLNAGQEGQAASILLEVSGYLVARADVRRTLDLYEPIALVEKGLEYAPRDVPTMVQLIQLYRETLQNEKAVAMCRRALEVDPKNDQIKQLLERLAPAPGPLGAR